MSILIEIPAVIASKAMELGIDIEQEVLEYLIQRLRLDPELEARIHLELADKFLSEGKRLSDSDPVQAAEKLYKAAEEAIKAMAIRLNLTDVLTRVTSRGRWTVTDLERAVRELRRRIGPIVVDAWSHAWYLHVLGFHEAKLDSDGVKERMKPIEDLVRKAHEILGSGTG